MPLSFTKHPSKQPLALYAAKIPAGFPSPAEDHMDGKLDLNEHLIRRPAATYFVHGWALSAANPNFADIPLTEIGCEVWGVVAHSIRRHCNR